mgnify:CR=1 FL=1
MGDLPLHPAVVHLPLGLAFVMPLVAAGIGWAIWTGRVPLRAWILVAVLQCLLMAAGLFATNTGQRDEHRMAQVVDQPIIDAHEAVGEQFVWGAVLTVGLAMMVLMSMQRGLQRALMAATLAGTLVVALLGFRVAVSGGRLVYIHHAAATQGPPSR